MSISFPNNIKELIDWRLWESLNHSDWEKCVAIWVINTR